MRPSPHRAAWLTLLIVVLSACSSDASPTPRASGAADAPASAAGTSPEASSAAPDSGPLPSLTPIARELPAPELETAEDIGAALMSRSSRPQGVVSLLHQLGIGTYSDDGEPITPGAEVDGGTLWLTESEVFALVEMAAAEHPLDFIEFRDWHAGLRELGLEMSVDELVAAYEEAYFARSEPSFFVDVLFASGVDLQAEGFLTRLHAWLLLLDGFVVGAEPEADAGIALASYHEPQWGGASAHIPRLLAPGTPLTAAELTALIARLEPLVRATPLQFEPPRAVAHEGHDAPGDETRVRLRFVPLVLTNPALDIGFHLVPQQQPAGLPVTLVASDPGVLEEHGTMVDARGGNPFAGGSPVETDSNGVVELTYTPRQEEADGEGEVTVEPITITANVQLADIARHTWLLPEILYALLPGERSVTATLDVEWHEVEGLRVEMVDEYEVTIDLILGVGRAVGTDTFTGFLAYQGDDTWRGIVTGTVDASWSFESMGDSCSTPLVATQELLAIAQPLRNPIEGRDLGIRLYPIAPPQITQIGCDISLTTFEGDSPDDPTIPRGTGLPSGEYAPFNDTRVTDPTLGGVQGRLPRSGSETVRWTEELAGVGGGTWTVTIERVEPDAP